MPITSYDYRRILHLDSLGRVQLQSALERRLGLEFEDDVVAGVQTLGDLRALLEREGIRVSTGGWWRGAFHSAPRIPPRRLMRLRYRQSGRQ